MKVFFLLFIYILFLPLNSFAEVKLSNYKDIEITKTNFELQEISKGLNSPWGMTFLDDENFLITEKTGRLLKININTGIKTEINHELNVHTSTRQGGLLDVLYHDGYVYFSYSHNIDKKFSSTAIARGNLIKNSIKNLEVIFIANPKIKYSDVHFGSRITIKDNYLFASLGERGKGMIAQNPSQHPGSIIRINLDGSIPKDNPKFKEKSKNNWLPEIFQIGVRNPQGMALSPFDNKIYLSNHGARGGDWFGTANYGENYGWKILGWGGTNYSGTKIGPKWKKGFTKPIKYWVPSIAVSAISIYKGNEFKEWNGDALITSLKDKSLRKIKFEDTKLINEEVIFKGAIGRIRDIKIQKETGEIYLLSDDGSLWRMHK